MNYALILAGGVGQRMRNSGLPKQFLEVFRKPIIIYTLEKFEECMDIDNIVISCNSSWKEHMSDLVEKWGINKVKKIVLGGKNRQDSIKNGLDAIKSIGGNKKDIVVIHDGVRPLIEKSVICENIRMASKFGSAMTVRPVIESVVVTSKNKAIFDDFKKRNDTYSLTSPQTFTVDILENMYSKNYDKETIPLLDAALLYTYGGHDIHIIKENNLNIKVTTPEDYYVLKALLELEENKFVFGI